MKAANITPQDSCKVRAYKQEAKILRQSLQNRITHWGVALSCFVLIFSGILQMPISKRYMLNELPLMGWSGDYHISLIVHYLGAAALLFFVFLHLSFHVSRREFDILPQKGDVKKSLQIMKAMMFGGEEPPSGKYLPEQKLAYVGIGGVILLLVITGVVKTFKNLAGFNLSDGVYFWSAQLHNLGLILLILGIIAHLGAFIFKPNRKLLPSMFSGKVEREYATHRHGLWDFEAESTKDSSEINTSKKFAGSADSVAESKAEATDKTLQDFWR